MLISVVVPCMNEEASIPHLVERLMRAVALYQDRAEILLVDDGSTDGTWAAIQTAQQTCKQLRGLRLSANRGHQVALTAGLEAAQGERIFMLDADLQDPPELLGDMMGMMDRGYDVVYGRRCERQGETVFKRATAWAFYRVLDAVLSMPERARFVRGMFAWAGFNQIGIEYTRAPRAMGETKYPLRKMVRFAVDAMTAFSTKPLKFATRMSFASLGFSALMMIYVLHSLIVYQTAPGWASVVLAISLFSGVQLLTLGILGEYIGRCAAAAQGGLSHEPHPSHIPLCACRRSDRCALYRAVPGVPAHRDAARRGQRGGLWAGDRGAIWRAGCVHLPERSGRPCANVAFWRHGRLRVGYIVPDHRPDRADAGAGRLVRRRCGDSDPAGAEFHPYDPLGLFPSLDLKAIDPWHISIPIRFSTTSTKARAVRRSM